MNNQVVSRDERSIVVENASYRIAYLVMSFGLLVIIGYRGFVLQQSSWDLLGLVLLGGVVTSAYQSYHQILSRQWVITMIVTVVIAGIIAILFTSFM